MIARLIPLRPGITSWNSGGRGPDAECLVRSFGPREHQLLAAQRHVWKAAGTVGPNAGDRGGFRAAARRIDAARLQLCFLIREFDPRYRRRVAGEQLDVHPSERSDIVDPDRRAERLSGI